MLLLLLIEQPGTTEGRKSSISMKKGIVNEREGRTCRLDAYSQRWWRLLCRHFLLFPGLWEETGLEDALERYSAVRAMPIASAVQPETTTIFTWYKFKLVSVISKATTCEPCEASPSIPPVLLPLERNEIAIPFEDGTATVDGVAITAEGRRGLE